MNENRNTYQNTDEKGQERSVQNLFEIRALQLLLAGLYFLLGIRLTKADKAYQRERAIIMRKSISAANLVIDTKKGNKDALNSFTNDHGPSWWARIRELSNSAEQNNPHPEATRSVGTRRTGIMAGNAARQSTNPSSPRRAFARRPQDEVLLARAPP